MIRNSIFLLALSTLAFYVGLEIGARQQPRSTPHFCVQAADAPSTCPSDTQHITLPPGAVVHKLSWFTPTGRGAIRCTQETP